MEFIHRNRFLYVSLTEMDFISRNKILKHFFLDIVLTDNCISKDQATVLMCNNNC